MKTSLNTGSMTRSLASRVCVTGMARWLVDQVNQHPPKVRVRNGSGEPIYDVRAWIAHRLIVFRDPDGRWVGAMHDLVPPQRELTTSFEWGLEPADGSPLVTVEFTDAWPGLARDERSRLVPLVRRALQNMVNDDNVGDPFLW